MGGSESTASTTSSTTNTNQNIAIQSDLGAIAEAFGFARSSTSASNNLLSGAIDGITRATRDTIDAVTGSSRNQSYASQSVARGAFDAITSSSRNQNYATQSIARDAFNVATRTTRDALDSNNAALSTVGGVIRDSLGTSERTFDLSAGLAGQSLDYVSDITASNLEFARTAQSEQNRIISEAGSQIGRANNDALNVVASLATTVLENAEDSERRSQEFAGQSLALANAASDGGASNVTKIAIYALIAAAAGAVFS